MSSGVVLLWITMSNNFLHCWLKTKLWSSFLPLKKLICSSIQFNNSIHTDDYPRKTKALFLSFNSFLSFGSITETLSALTETLPTLSFSFLQSKTLKKNLSSLASYNAMSLSFLQCKLKLPWTFKISVLIIWFGLFLDDLTKFNWLVDHGIGTRIYKATFIIIIVLGDYMG